MPPDPRLNGASARLTDDEPAVNRPTPAARYLAVAADLARRGGEDTWAHLASQVALPDLAERLGVSRTALYRRWPTRRDFWIDLAAYLGLGNDFAQPAAVLPWNQPLEAFSESEQPAAGLLETVRRIQNELQQIVLADVWIVVRAAQLAFAEMPELADIRARVEQRRIAQLADQIERRLLKESLQLRAPSTAHDLAVTMWCVTDGLAVLSWHLPDVAAERVVLDDGTGPRPWGVLGFAYRALLLGLTVPLARADATTPTTAGPPTDAADVPLPSERWTARQHEALATATTMLLERLVAESADGQLDVLGHVTVNRIARAAGVSRRAVYDVWPTRDALVLDLLSTLLDDDIRRTIAVFDAADDAARSGSPTSLGRIIDALVFDTAASARGGHELQQAVLAALPQAHRPSINSILRSRHDRLVGALAPRIEAIVRADGAPLRPDLTAQQLTLTFLALESGARRILRSNPTAVRRPTPTTQSTFATAVDALAATSVA